MNGSNKNDIARAFLAAPKNTVTRERMYFNRLYFELKLAGLAETMRFRYLNPRLIGMVSILY